MRILLILGRTCSVSLVHTNSGSAKDDSINAFTEQPVNEERKLSLKDQLLRDRTDANKFLEQEC